MVLKAVVKALKKADRLKERMLISKDLLTDNEAWLSQQQLQRVYQQVLILDLEYALDKKVEQDLWNHGFKNFIANLQNSARDKKNPKHSECQAMLYWCLEAASGFYLSLLHELCAAFDLDLPFRRKGSIYGCNKNISSIPNHCQPNKSSCYYICQHCLVHLGDIARYKNQSRQAEVFYSLKESESLDVRDEGEADRFWIIAVQKKYSYGINARQFSVFIIATSSPIGFQFQILPFLHVVRLCHLNQCLLIPVQWPMDFHLPALVHDEVQEVIRIWRFTIINQFIRHLTQVRISGGSCIMNKYAVQLSPNSGQPYNQLAILEASRGDKLSTVYHYVRSVALRHPFPVAATNLSRTLDKHAEELVKLDGHSKLSSYEYITTFLKLHGLLHTHAELETAEKLVQILTTSLTAHIATESLSSWKLVQIVTVNIFALHRAGGCIDGKIRSFNEEELTEDEQKIKLLICDLLAASLSAFLLPVYTIKLGESLLDYFAMPAIKLTLEWVKQEPKVLQKSSFKKRLQIWPSLCKLLNDVQPTVADFNLDSHSHVPLPEDRDLQGFLPFEKCFQNYKFHIEDFKLDVKALNKLRVARLVDFGVWLSEQTGLNLITCKKTLNNGKNVYVFEATGRQEPPSGEQIREFEEMTLTKLPSPTPSDASGSITGASTPDSSGFFSSILVNPILKFKNTEFSSQENLQEKRPGILKSQNNPEKNLEKAKNEKIVKTLPSNRGQRNVALQTIINKNSEEIKQVTFKSPSPTKESGKDSSAPTKKHVSSKSIDQKNSTEASVKKFDDTGKDKKFVKQLNNGKGKSKDCPEELDRNASQQKLTENGNTHAGKKITKTDPNENGKDTKQKDKNKEVPFTELMGAFPPLPGVKEGLKNSGVWSLDVMKDGEKESAKILDTKCSQKNVNKQQLLSELFSKNKGADFEQNQTQNMSGLLNLKKEQQQMLTDSKLLKNNSTAQQQEQQPQQQRTFTKADFPQLVGNVALQKLKCNDKIEAARREYEAAYFALQQKKDQDSYKRFHESDVNQFEYDRRMNMDHQQAPQVQQQNQPQVYVRVNQPLINFGAFGFKYPQYYLPWQETQETSMPPSWWSETPQAPQSQQQQQHQIKLDNPYFQDPISYEDKCSYEIDWSYQPYPINVTSYIAPPSFGKLPEHRPYQINDSFSGAQPSLQSDYTTGHQGNDGPSVCVGGNSYSLFSNPSWNTVPGRNESEPGQNYNLPGGIMTQQSFWSGPGPSPLERLLEQQKQMREATPLEPKNGT